MKSFSKQVRNQQGFTLLELLVVLAILAIVAGGLIVAYDGLEGQAAKQDASRSIAGVDNGLRLFAVSEGGLPNDMDSLAAATPADGQQITQIQQGSEALLASLGSKFAGKLQLITLTAGQVSALNNAGITRLRYIDAAGNQVSPNCPATAPCALTTLAADGSAASVQAIDLADIPVRVFDVPRPGDGRNRGRGYSATLQAGDQVVAWIPGDGGINLTKVGASAAGSQVGGTQDPNDDDILIVVGIGNNSSMFTAASLVGNTNMSNAPVYGDVARNEYARYAALINLGSLNVPAGTATLQAVVDARGDFLDEELAEASLQKT